MLAELAERSPEALVALADRAAVLVESVGKPVARTLPGVIVASPPADVPEAVFAEAEFTSWAMTSEKLAARTRRAFVVYIVAVLGE